MIKKMIRSLNFFEKLLLIVGLAVTIVGFYFINRLYLGEGKLSWALLQASFLWLLLIFLVILTDSNETVKEELKDTMMQHIEETILLKKVVEEQLDEIKGLRRDLHKKKR
ncbi:MAG: hypothetical protein ACE5DM_02620 [Candidatus Nanoarchaeia archaeon]